MAEQQDETKLKYEQLIDVEAEQQKMKEFVEIALQSADDSWTVYNTNDKKLSVIYKQMPGSNVNTICGKMQMKTDIDPEIFYKYLDSGFDDIYIDAVKNDPRGNLTENRILKVIDSDHQIVYQSTNTGFMLVSPRDFTYIRRRFKLADYTFNGVKYKTIIGGFGYSVHEDHPLNVPTKQGHVRAHVAISGNMISQREDAAKNELEAYRILALDPCGMIPQWIKNKIAPAKGMEVKDFVEKHWQEMEEVVKTREHNDFQKQHQALF